MKPSAMAALAVAAPLLLACCGDSGAGERSAASPVVTPTAAASQAPPATSAPTKTGAPTGEGGRIGGGSSGVTLRLPAGWKGVDPLNDSSAVVRTTFGLDGDTGPLIRSLMERQVKQGTVFAIDTSVASGLAPHLQAGCDRGGMVGASLEQLKRKQQALAPGSKITDLTVGGKPGFKATYDSQKRSGPVSGLTVRVPVAADRFCFVDIEARQGGLPAEAEKIAASFEPT
ncbi:hypothetical protein [Actinomadura sp. 21ATH]|uniref:hypothetical protein n=1 Tax=Actinomadura sp. 21ATH TaxID=1735444 RepID=UPI0035C1F280